MPDRRRHRGPHPEDQHLFAPECHPALRLATLEYSWMLSRSYPADAALKLVGDHHGLTARQRMAVRRSACSDGSHANRARKHTDAGALVGRRMAIDGYNLLITIESALSGGVILIGRDGCARDLASIHGTYRKVEVTVPALTIAARALVDLGVGGATWLLDRPVSNSGRLRALMEETFARVLADRPRDRPGLSTSETPRPSWAIELVARPDDELCRCTDVVVTSDSLILDHCAEWTNLAATIIERWIPRAWIVDMSAI